jgi:hypothetical protein
VERPKAHDPAGDDRGMLRLDPAYPPLWRDEATVQFGADPVAVITGVAVWQERLLSELESGIPDAALEPIAAALGAPAGAAGEFVRRISRAMATPVASAPPRVILQLPDRPAVPALDAVGESLEAAGFDVLTGASAISDEHETHPTVLMLAHHIIEPRRAAVLMGRDIPHLPVVFTGTRVEIGPFVRPGRTACLACVAAHRCEADPAWPQLAAQLLGRTPPAVSLAAMWEAGLTAARMLSAAERRPGRQTVHSVTLRVPSGGQTTRTHRPHAACRCRSLGGTGTAPDPEIRWTTTATAFAQPA